MAAKAEEAPDGIVVESNESSEEAALEPEEPGFIEEKTEELHEWAEKKNMFNLDLWFCYDTDTIMRLLDRRLGFVNFFMRICLWSFVLGYMLIGNERYFVKSPGYGPVSVKLVNDTYTYATGKGAESSKLSFTAFDSVDVVHPYLETGAMFLITQIEKTQGQAQGEDGVWTPKPESKKVVLSLDVEEFQVRYLAHVSFPKIDPTGKQRYHTTGFNNAPDEPGESTISVKDLLEKGGLSLSSIKSTGALIQVTVLWNCFLLLSSCEPTLEVARLDTAPELGYSAWRTRRYATPIGSKRDLEKCTGIRMIWRSKGSGNQIDVIGIIFFIAVGVAIMPVASFVTEFVMLFVLPERKHYEGKIFKKMPDFYQLDEIQAERDEAERRRKETESAVDVEALLAASDD